MSVEAAHELNARRQRWGSGLQLLRRILFVPTHDRRFYILGRACQDPWAEAAEAVRLGHPLYVTPGTYTFATRTAAGKAEVEVEPLEPLEPREPQMKKEPEIRGQKDDGAKPTTSKKAAGRRVLPVGRLASQRRTR